MKIIYRGDEYDLPDPTLLTRPEASFIKNQTGLTLLQLGEALQAVDLDAMCAYLHVAKKRAGEKVKWSDFDDTSFSDFEWPDEDDEQEPGEADTPSDEEVEPDPT